VADEPRQQPKRAPLPAQLPRTVKSDPRYKALHRIGILTVNQQKYGMDELQKILNGHLPSV